MTNMKSLGVLLLAFLAAQPTSAQDVVPLAFQTRPVNTAALSGTNATMFCTYTNLASTNTLRWLYNNGGGQIPIYRSTTGMVAGFGDRYDFDVNAAIGQYNLIIRSASRGVSGVYVCDAVDDNDAQVPVAFVTVEELQCPDQEQFVVAGEPFTALCSAVYYTWEPTGQAYLIPTVNWTWSDLEVMEQANYYSNTTYVETSITNATITDRFSMPRNLTCNLEFKGTGAPTYTASCTTSYYALYGVERVEVSNIQDGVELLVGTEIWCTGFGRPTPNVTWFDSEYNVVSTEQRDEVGILTPQSSWVGRGPQTFICRAGNTVNGESYAQEANVTFVTVAIPEVKSGGVETWVIVVSVVVPVVVLAVIGVILFIFCYKKKKNEKKTGNNYRPPNGNAVVMTSTTPTAAPREPENQPFLLTSNPQSSQPAYTQPRYPNVSYEPAGRAQPVNASGFADIGPAPGSAIDRSLSRGGTPTQMTYPYVGSVGSVNAVGSGAAPLTGGRGTPAITIGPSYGAGGGATPGRLTPANLGQNPPASQLTYPYHPGSRQLSDVSSDSSSQSSGYPGMAPQRTGPAGYSQTGYPSGRPGGSLSNSLV